MRNGIPPARKAVDTFQKQGSKLIKRGLQMGSKATTGPQNCWFSCAYPSEIVAIGHPTWWHLPWYGTHADGNKHLYMAYTVSGNTYHIITATNLMMASLRESKNSFRAWPCSFMLPITNPKHMEKTTSPRALTPFTDPGTGTNSSVILVRVSMASDTLFITAPTSVSLDWTGTLKLLFS